MELLIAALYGAVQGLTEFLPVSSTGHLVFLHDLLHVDVSSAFSFDVALHIGTFIALLLFFWRDVVRYVMAICSGPGRSSAVAADRRIAWYLIVATVPAVLAGVFADSIVETTFRSATVVAISLAVGGIAFVVFDRYFGQGTRRVEEMTLLRSLVVGLAQVIALVPGVSRSGSTIIASMGVGMKRDEAARFSFLLSMPVVFGAVIKKVLDQISYSYTGHELALFGIGVLGSAIVGVLAIRFLLRYLARHSLAVFAWYRLALAAAIVVWLVTR